MTSTSISSRNFTQGYEELVRRIVLDGEKTETTRELRNASLSFKSRGFSSGLLGGPRNISYKYLFGELYWYLSGSNKLEDIMPYSKFWGNISDDGITSNSAYGYIMMSKYGFDQIQYVIDTLKRDRDSRQAVIHIKGPSDKPTKDMNCTLSLQFFIRNGELECITNMRSNDMWRGIVYDVPFFCLVQNIIAISLGVEPGLYTHNMASAHIYLSDFEKHKDTFMKITDGYVGTYLTGPQLADNYLKSQGCTLFPGIPKYEDLSSSKLLTMLQYMHERVIESGK